MEMDSEPPKPTHLLGLAATWAVAITLICVLIGEGAAQFANLNTPNGGALASGPAGLRAIDYSTTGSIKGQAIVINPCTGKQAGP